MMRRFEMDRYAAADLDPVAPVAGMNAHAGRVAAHDRIVAERGHHERIVRRLQPGQRRAVEVVVVIMAEQDEVDRRQVREANAGFVDALRTGEGKWRGAPRPDGI